MCQTFVSDVIDWITKLMYRTSFFFLFLLMGLVASPTQPGRSHDPSPTRSYTVHFILSRHIVSNMSKNEEVFTAYAVLFFFYQKYHSAFPRLIAGAFKN